MRIIELFKVAFYKPYMLRAILTARCPQCRRWFSFPIIRRQRTMYQDDYSNFFCGCKCCQEENDRYWDGMWEDYYSGRL